jgi:hypothetical protein
MKLVLFTLFTFGFSIFVYAMQQKESEAFFPLEGKHFTGEELLQKYRAWHPGYDTDTKFYEFPHHPALFTRYRNAIIHKKLGIKVLEFIQAQQNHEWSQSIIRYSKAVTFRLATICTSEASDAQLIEAEGQIPYNYREYFYITLGNNVNLSLYENEEVQIPSVQEYRNQLNSFLNNFKTKIENNHEK